jgi:hypothetical protein
VLESTRDHLGRFLSTRILPSKVSVSCAIIGLEMDVS